MNKSNIRGCNRQSSCRFIFDSKFYKKFKLQENQIQNFHIPKKFSSCKHSKDKLLNFVLKSLIASLLASNSSILTKSKTTLVSF